MSEPTERDFGPKEGELVDIKRGGGGAATYRVADVQHKEGSGIWTYTLEPVPDEASPAVPAAIPPASPATRPR